MGSVFRSTSLFFKVILVTSLILILALSFSAWMGIRLHEATIKRLTYEKTRIISEFIERHVIRSMERGRHFDIHRILQNYAYKGILKINVFRPDGTIVATTRDGELNENVGDVDFFLKNRGFIEEEMVRQDNGKKRRERVYYFNRPILNHPDCFQCHDAKETIVGVLTVANSLKELDDQVYKGKRDVIVFAVITIGSLCSVLGLLFLKFVNLPITRLSETMSKVEEGDLNARADIKGKDEMGRLAQNLNTMIEKLNLARTEAEQYHRELIQRADRMASIGELASGVAHEIRNPLAGIQGAIQILGDGFPKEDGRKEITDEIQKQIYRLERLVKNLLNYAKPAATNYLPTDINGLVDKVVSFFTTQRGKSEDLKVEKKLFPSIPEVMMDPNSMEQAFLNILINAQKAMPEGGTLKVSTLHLNREEDGTNEIKVVFEDTGIGIPNENLHKIFNPFFSTRSDGTGLGLAITKNIVEQQGGRIEVESRVGVGTKFIITLPVTR